MQPTLEITFKTLFQLILFFIENVTPFRSSLYVEYRQTEVTSILQMSHIRVKTNIQGGDRMWKYARARSDELFHYGVKGMKWGVRRTPEQLGHSPKVAKAGKRVILKEKSSGGEKGLKTQPSSALRKGIRSLEKRVEDHYKKIQAPEKYCKDWDSYTERAKSGLIKHWKQEIDNFNDSISNRIDELKKRGENYE